MRTEHEHDVDVVIPVLNGVKTIQAAIDSALNQHNVNTCVIVVDAGSTDRTIEIVEQIDDPRIRLISGMGALMAGAARNLGVDSSNSSWITFLDADDLWPYDRLYRMIRAISDPSSEIAVGRMIIFPDGADISLSREWPIENSQLAPVAGGVLLSRSLFYTVGQFDLDLRVGEFIDWMIRARNLGIREVLADTVVLLRRNHENNTSKIREEEYASSVLSILLKNSSRQRKPLPD